MTTEQAARAIEAELNRDSSVPSLSDESDVPRNAWFLACDECSTDIVEVLLPELGASIENDPIYGMGYYQVPMLEGLSPFRITMLTVHIGTMWICSTCGFHLSLPQHEQYVNAKARDGIAAIRRDYTKLYNRNVID